MSGQGTQSSAAPTPVIEARSLKSEFERIGTMLAGDDFAGALRETSALIGRFPQSPQAWLLFGLAQRGLGRLPASETALRKAIDLAPRMAECHDALIAVLRQQGKVEATVMALRKALEHRPGEGRLHASLGAMLADRGEFAGAAAAYRRAAALWPDNAGIHNNLGVVFKEMGGLEEAIASFREALRIDPALHATEYNLGVGLQDLGRLDEASEAFARAEAIRPDYDKAIAKRLNRLARQCDWRNLEADAPAIARLGTGEFSVEPFTVLSFEDNPARQQARARLHARQRFPQRAIPFAKGYERRPGRIRIGYLSSDFRPHPVTQLMGGLWREHDRNRFETFFFNYGETSDNPVRRAVMPHADHFFDIAGMPDHEIIALARGHDLDIAVDLNGYTLFTHTRLFALRLAPVQVNFLAYPGTMGADFMDCIIADPVLIPEAERGYYDEKIVYLPNSYMPCDNHMEIAPDIGDRQSHGLPPDSLVLCNFNQCYKFKPPEFDIWMRVMRQLPGSVLWIMDPGPVAAANLRREAQARGIEPERIVLAGRAPLAEHLARHAHADLFVDNFIYNAHTTGMDALFAGLPMVTKPGRQFASRVGASLLTAAGLPELVTGSDEAYEALILNLASDRARLAAIRAKLVASQPTSPLFDTVRYTRDFEDAMERLVAQAR